MKFIKQFKEEWIRFKETFGEKFIVKNVDKILHLLAGMIIQLSVSIFSIHIAFFIAVIVLGIAREYYNHESKKGSIEILDLLFTILGGLIVYLNQLYLLNYY